MIETIATKQLAAILGISVQRVNELGRKGKIQREADGGWDLVKVNAALRKNLNKSQTLKSLGQKSQDSDEQTSEESADDNIRTFAEAQRRHEWLKVQKEELALKLRRGELVEKLEVEKQLGVLLTTFRNRMLLMPDKIAPRVAVTSDVLECRVLVEREVRETLSILSEYQPDAA